jgi:Ran GTPase-activating protein (RanGAP) involved in mRNA processing and transport
MTGWQIQNNLNDRVTSQMIESKGTVEVDLSFNGLGDDEAEELARVIKQSKTIKRLILANNHIHQKGAKAIAEGVPSLPCVSQAKPPVIARSCHRVSAGASGPP